MMMASAPKLSGPEDAAPAEEASGTQLSSV